MESMHWGINEPQCDHRGVDETDKVNGIILIKDFFNSVYICRNSDFSVKTTFQTGSRVALYIIYEQ